MSYFNHYTVDTKHNYQSHRSEVDNEIVAMMKEWVKKMAQDEVINIYDNYYCELLDHNNKFAHFHISVKQNNTDYDVLKFTVCLHSRLKAKALQIVEAEEKSLDVPFIAVKLINPPLVDIALGDFERCIAWGFYEYVQENKNAVS